MKKLPNHELGKHEKRKIDRVVEILSKELTDVELCSLITRVSRARRIGVCGIKEHPGVLALSFSRVDEQVGPESLLFAEHDRSFYEGDPPYLKDRCPIMHEGQCEQCGTLTLSGTKQAICPVCGGVSRKI